ncbi:MAG: hypothetical protein C4527_00980 [Candidatus Omnitrophota bacterium]|jgi:predicted nuclease of predicted toxin-antitoxin system|nr:MAG: hypothetical protein C4527_00980 [Candidatus Omnitrophota bacterium]
MKTKILIDMNLSPKWKLVFEQAGFEALHWSEIGEPDALDETIMEWSRSNGYIVFTNDLDFNAILINQEL